MSNNKYALYSYSTENIGDDIQSIAARRFLPSIDYMINRDHVGEWKNLRVRENVKLIANGWYMRRPFAWPITDKTIDPLLVSMYIEQNAVEDDVSAKDVFLTPESRDYLTKFGPVGARDMSTLKLLTDNGIDAYFSGCLTLTLQRDQEIAKEGYILAIDVPDSVVDYMRSKTKRRVIKVSPYRDFDLGENDRMVIGEYFLYLYQAAHAVVTTRLHATLPCLALGTPVLLIKQKGRYDPARYAGLGELARNATPKEYLQDYSIFNLDTPGDNPKGYMTIRNNLIKKCSEFTGFNNNKTWRTVDVNNIHKNESFIATFCKDFSGMHQKLLLAMDVDYLKRQLSQSETAINELRNQVDKNRADNRELARQANQYRAELDKTVESKSYKVGLIATKPLRVAKSLFRRNEQK